MPACHQARSPLDCLFFATQRVSHSKEPQANASITTTKKAKQNLPQHDQPAGGKRKNNEHPETGESLPANHEVWLIMADESRPSSCHGQQGYLFIRQDSLADEANPPGSVFVLDSSH